MLLVAVALLCICDAAALSSSDRVTSLPDFVGNVGEMYSGYLTVDKAHGKNLHYIFFPSLRNPTTDPVVFWTNGGPGCSALGGLFSEHGPFFPNGKGGLVENPYAWRNVSNMLYVEQPAGVGFSYSDTPSDYNTDDFKVALDNRNALLAFYEKFPEYATNSLYLSGESYGGEYIPHLGAEVLTYNLNASTRINLKGIVVGNPVFWCPSADFGTLTGDLQVENYFYHGLVSYSMLQKWRQNGCATKQSEECSDLFDELEKQIGVIYQPTRSARLRRRGSRQLPVATQKKLPVEPNLNPDCLFHSFCSGNGTLRFADQPDSTAGEPTCYPVNDQITDYLNRKDAQAALNMDAAKIAAPDGKWADCADAPLNYQMSLVNTINYYRQMFNLTDAKTFSVLVFSGDADIATVPMPNTQVCLAELSDVVTPTKKWSAWTVHGVTAGYWEVFDRYTFASIKGAGHEAPLYQPRTAYNMFARWLDTHSLVEN